MAPAPPTAVSQGSIHRTGFGGTLVQETPTKRLLSHPALLARISSAALNLQLSLENSHTFNTSSAGLCISSGMRGKRILYNHQGQTFGFLSGCFKRTLVFYKSHM